jgi:hypothetical protein
LSNCYKKEYEYFINQLLIGYDKLYCIKTKKVTPVIWWNNIAHQSLRDMFVYYWNCNKLEMLSKLRTSEDKRITVASGVIYWLCRYRLGLSIKDMY